MSIKGNGKMSKMFFRAGAVFTVSLIMVLFSFATCFAGDFRIESTYPEDGAKNTTKENMCVKVTFTTEVGNEASQKANKDAVRIQGPDNKEVPSIIYYSKEDPKYALIHIDTTKVVMTGKNPDIKDNTEYRCTISGNFRDNEGNTLGEDQVISFTTQDQGKGMLIYMILMGVLMVGMVVFSVIQSRKELMAAAEDAGKDETFNPYKEAKRTGKSVEEVILEHQKKNKKKEKEKEENDDPKRDGSYYRVKRPHPVSEAGSTYKTGRKAKAEAEAKRKAEAKARRKKEGYSKKKNKKK